MKFNVRQQKVINATENKILCLSAPATGKTSVITGRVKSLIEERGVKPQDIVSISFTNMAADEMKRRLGEIAEGAFIGTIHSYGNKVCVENGVETLELLANQDFDKILELAIKVPVNKYPRVGHLLVDECQDLSPLEAQFLSRIPAKNVFYVGDDRQMIYSFRGSSVQFLRNMWADNNYTKYYLTENYRNAPNIVKFAESFLNSMEQLSPHSVPKKTKLGILEEHCSFNDALEELEWSQNWGSWFVLTRTNNELAAAQKELEKRGIPSITFKKGDLDCMELDNLMTSNKVKVLTIHSAKGLENKNVIVIGARYYNEEERKIAYVAATRAENALYWCGSIAKRGYMKHPIPKSALAGNYFEKDTEMITF